jgi:predicted MFS family arabinose efflux permease
MTPSPSRSAQVAIGPGLVLLMAIACGCGTGNIYYAQPLLNRIAADFGVTVRAAGLLQMAMQVGYGAGILVFVPLGDLLERRRLIAGVSCAVACSLAWVASSTRFPGLLAASLVMGGTAQLSQLLIPFASDLSPAHRRGKVVGSLMAGLLIGILLARTVSGLIAEAFGWRAVFWLASGVMALLAVILWAALPATAPKLRASYGAALRSVGRIFLDSAPLRRSSFVGCLSFAAFSAFWTTLSFRLETPPLHYGADVAGLFGLLGVAGAVASLLAGRSVDRHGPGPAVRRAFLGIMAAFLLYWLLGHTLPGLAAGVILMDAGVQGTQVALQAHILALAPAASNRANTVYMVTRFAGGALGSVAGAYAWSIWGWSGVCAVSLALLAAGLAAHERPGD